MELPVICFDLDDTLYEQSAPFQDALATLSLPDTLDMEKAFQRFRMHSHTLFHVREQGKLSMEDMHIQRIQQTLADFSMMICKKEALAFQRAYEAFQQALHFSEGIEELLTLIKKKNIPLYVITNGPTQHQWKKIEGLQLTKWVDASHIIVSETVGYTKPDPRIFHLVSETGLYIGDSYENDVVGAKRAGWQVVWLNKLGLPKGEVTPDYEVHSNPELLSFMEALLS